MARLPLNKRFVIWVRTGRGSEDFTPVASYDKYDEVTAAAEGIVSEYWTPTLAYTYIGSIWDTSLAPGRGGHVASVLGEDFRVVHH